eukprot:16315-Chlamydomonas_euryale.AAC.1
MQPKCSPGMQPKCSPSTQPKCSPGMQPCLPIMPHRHVWEHDGSVEHVQHKDHQEPHTVVEPPGRDDGQAKHTACGRPSTSRCGAGGGHQGGGGVGACWLEHGGAAVPG